MQKQKSNKIYLRFIYAIITIFITIAFISKSPNNAKVIYLKKEMVMRLPDMCEQGHVFEGSMRYISSEKEHNVYISKNLLNNSPPQAYPPLCAQFEYFLVICDNQEFALSITLNDSSNKELIKHPIIKKHNNIYILGFHELCFHDSNLRNILFNIYKNEKEKLFYNKERIYK